MAICTNYGFDLEERQAICFSCNKHKVRVFVWPGNKTPRKLCAKCKTISHNTDDWLLDNTLMINGNRV